MRQAIAVSIFSFVLSFSVALLYWILRFGFLDNSLLIIVKVLGVSAFVILSPVGFSYVRHFFSEAVNKTFFNDSILPIYALALISVIGFITPIIHLNISIVFVAAGYGLLLISLYQFIKDGSLLNKSLLILIACLFGLWVGPVSWVFGYLKPAILESWAIAGTDRLDTFFHIAIAQMIKSYDVATIGLDGIPFMNYHWGSHWMFAQVSNFLNLPVMVIYQLFYPAVIVALFFRVFLSFVIEIKQLYRPDADGKKLNFFFWIIFLTIFIGFIQNFWAGNELAFIAGTGTGATGFFITSESYGISILLLFAILSMLVNFWQRKDSLKITHKALLLLFLLPLLVAILGFIKVSTLFMLGCLLGYLYLRFSLFKSWLFTLSMLLTFLTSVLIALVVFEPRENHGDFSLFYFYRERHISLALFSLLSYSWAVIFTVVYIVKEKLYRHSFHLLVRSGKLMPIELIWVLALVGFLLTVFVRLQNYDALYFTEIQMWVAAALTLVYIPFYKHEREGNRSWGRIFKLTKITFSKPAFAIVPVTVILLLIIFYVNTKVYLVTVAGNSIGLHGLIMNNESKKKLRIRDILRTYVYENDSVPAFYARNESLSFFKKLEALDTIPLAEKRKSLVYVDLRAIIKKGHYKGKLYCYNLPFVIPSLTGMAMIDGIDATYFDDFCYQCCEQLGFGYAYFPKWKTREQIDAPADINDLCKRTKAKGFETLFYYNLEKKAFEKIDCH